MKKLKKGQKGLTLVELVIVIGLTSIVAAVITGTILGVFNTDAHTRNSMIAVYQVRHAGKLVSEDILQAQTVNTKDNLDTPEFELLSLTWKEGGTEVQHMVIYTLKDVPSSELKILWREHYVKESIDFELDSTTKVAEYIDPDRTSCCCDCDGDGVCDDNCNCSKRVVIFTVTATVGADQQQVSETRVYQVKPRPRLIT